MSNPPVTNMYCQHVMSEKKARSPRFTPEEKLLIANLALEVREIIENKKTDTANSKRKEAAWKKIAEEFNANNPVQRTWEAIKTCYINMKEKARREIENSATDINMRGEERTPATKMDLLETMRDMLYARESVDVTSYLDSDAEYFEAAVVKTEMDADAEGDYSEPCREHTMTDENTDSRSKPEDNERSWGKWKSQTYEESTAAKQRRGFDAVTEARLKLINSAQASLEREHQLKLNMYQKMMETADIVKKQEETKLALLQFELEKARRGN